MRLRQSENADKAVVLGAMAAYAAGALIMISILLATSLWSSVAPPY
jgi:hypothetical protein